MGRPVDWGSVERVLVVRLRSIGDTVLATPTLRALRRRLPDAQIDILLEDWVAPLLDGHPDISNVVRVGKGSSERLKAAWKIRRSRYDVVVNLHGGTTSTFFTRFSGAKHRVGFANFQYSFLYTDLLSSSSNFWQREHTHSAEQQLALAGFVGIPVDDRPPSSLAVTPEALASIDHLTSRNEPFALIHPVAAFPTKQWAADKFARITEELVARGIKSVAVATPAETAVLDFLAKASSVPIETVSDLSLPEITALASRAKIFIGNDSGIAHIAAAVGTPSVVIFGSSNRHHWSPWTSAPSEMVFVEMECQPCAGYVCELFGQPKCILSVSTESVIDAVDRVMKKAEANIAPAHSSV